MEKPTNQSIEEVLKRLEQAMKECLRLSKLEEEVKAEKIKAHYEMMKAKDELRDLSFY